MLLKNAQPIVTNAEGARKTPSAIAFRDGGILYGVQALVTFTPYSFDCCSIVAAMLLHFSPHLLYLLRLYSIVLHIY